MSHTETFASATTLTFTWQYASQDPGGTVWDSAGYMLGDTETQLSVDSWPDETGSGTATVLVGAGQLFGFHVDSFDSTGGSGFLAINPDLVLPSPPPPPAIPEPRTPVLMLAGLAALFEAVRRRDASRG